MTFAAFGNWKLLACDPADGKVLWSIPIRGAPGPMATASNRLFYQIRAGTLSAFSGRTGKPLWETSLGSSTAPASLYSVTATTYGVYVTTSVPEVLALDPQTGKVRWRSSLDGSTHLVAAAAAGRVYVRLTARQWTADKLVALDASSGKPVWTFGADGWLTTLKPTDSGILVSQWRDGVLRAIRTADGTEAWSLDTHIIEPGPPAVCGDRIFVCGLARFTYLDFSGRILWEWDMQLDGVRVVHTRAKVTLMPDGVVIGPAGYRVVVGEAEPPAAKIPELIGLVRRAVASRAPSLQSKAYRALEDIAASRDPRAVRYLIEQLNNSEAPPSTRWMGYCNLARTGGAPGLEAVLAARDTGRSIRPIDEYCSPTQVLATRRDSAGTVWGLVSIPFAGHREDLWIATQHDGGWTSFVFTGDRRTRASDAADWFERYVGNRTLLADSDSDGWTDLVERRLGTDPANPDTDGDGLKDSSDRNPLAAPRPLSDVEQIIAAAFEARHRFVDRSHEPILVKLPEGCAPFEFHGCERVIVSVRQGDGSPLEEFTAEGTTLVTFGYPMRDLYGCSIRPENRKKGESILWSGDRTEAKLAMADTFGNLGGTGYDVHLRKFGDQWVVIRMELTVVA